MKNPPVPKNLASKTAFNPLAKAFKDQYGFTLIETILGIGVVMVMGATAFMVYEHTSNNRDVRTEQEHLQSMAEQTEKAYSAIGSFAGLTTSQAISSHVVPKNMVNGTKLRSVWGADVDVKPTDANGSTNNALKIIYQAVPEKACAKLAAATAEGAWDILINDVSVLTSHQNLDVTKATNLCADQSASKMEFTYYGGASGLAATVLAPVNLAPYVPPTPVTPSAPPAPVPAAPPAITPPGVATPPPAVTPPSIPPIITTPTAPPSVTPPGTPPAVGPSCVAPPSFNESENQTASCPGGQLLASGASSFQQSHNRTNTYSCPDPWGSPVLANGAWSAWSPAVASVCAPACVAPPPAARTETQQYAQSQTLGCQAGQTGSISQTRTVTQSRTITTNYQCSRPTGSATSSDSVGTWADSGYSAWQTTSNSCSTPAPPPPPPAPTGFPSGRYLQGCFAMSDGDSVRCQFPQATSGTGWIIQSGGPNAQGYTWTAVRSQALCASGRSRWIFIGGGPGDAAWEECF